MTVFNYIAVDSNGHTRKGLLEGNSYYDIRKQLRNMNLIALEISSIETKSNILATSILFRHHHINTTLLALITYQFGILLSVGIPIEAALLNVSEQIEKESIKIILLEIRSKVLEGQSLSESLNDYPTIFPKLYRATIAAGEKTGQLESVVNHLANFLEKQENIRQRIQQALIYPALLSVVSVAIIGFLLSYVMPKIISAFSENGQSLPAITQVLLVISNILTSYGLYIFLFLLALIFGIKYLLKKFIFQYYIHWFILKIPIVNKTVCIINATRFLRTFGILFIAGIPVIEAMQSANNTVTLIPMKMSIEDAISHVREGVSVHKALEMTNYFNKLCIQLISSGEMSGKLGILLEKASDYQDVNLSKWLTTALSLFEPIIIMVMGGIVLFIALAILLPIFQMNQFFG